MLSILLPWIKETTYYVSITFLALGIYVQIKYVFLLELEMHHLTPVTMWEIHINILNESRGVNCRDHFLKVKSTSYSRIFP